jgi:hypothetical protein
MRSKIAAMVAVSTVAGSVLANGINPPRPAHAGGGTQVTCIDRAAGSVARIGQAKLRYGDRPADGLEAKQRSAADQSVALSELTRVTLAEGNADRDGRVKGVITLARPAFEIEVLVRVRGEGGPLKVAGVSPTGEPVAVDVAACKEIVVRPPAPEPARPPTSAR